MSVSYNPNFGTVNYPDMSKYSKEEVLKVLAAHARELRLRSNLSQKDLAAQTNKDEQAIQRLEYAKTNPTFYFLFELAEGLDIHISDLVKIDFDKQIALLRSGALSGLPQKRAQKKATSKKTPAKKKQVKR